MLKRIGVSILTAIAFLTAVAQKSTSYEIEKDYPLFLEKMKQELTYPMAWGNSAQTDFSEWRKMARTIVLDAMLAPPPVAKDGYWLFSIHHCDNSGAKSVNLPYLSPL